MTGAQSKKDLGVQSRIWTEAPYSLVIDKKKASLVKGREGGNFLAAPPTGTE